MSETSLEIFETGPVRPRIAILLDPRFSGGTCSAVAREIDVMAAHANLRVYALQTKMFRGRRINPSLQDVLDAHGIEPVWNPKVIRSEIIALHNPSALKFETGFHTRLVCDRAFVITHENFLRPNGSEGFDVELCLGLISRALVARERWLVPVSAYNRAGVEAWVAANRSRWPVAGFEWFNICDFELKPPTDTPRDRRGRLSRPGFEKFPDLAVMEAHFPAHAESCAILGGDSFLIGPERIPDHWEVLPFGAMQVDAFFEKIDFFVYFTHPQWHESFGRVIAEAIAAGKVVITDPGTASIFGEAVIASEGSDVDAIIEGFVASPPRYRAFVEAAQATLARFGSGPFAAHILRHIVPSTAAPATIGGLPAAIRPAVAAARAELVAAPTRKTAA